MLEFKEIQKTIGTQFAKMLQKEKLYKVAIDRDEIVAAYLDSIPPEHNKIFRTRREYDCSCCKQFLRAAGSAVAIENGELVTIFDGVTNDPIWAAVLNALSTYVKSKPIVGYWFSEFRTVGTEKTFEQVENGARTWEHFFANVPANFVKHRQDWGSINGRLSSTRDVFERACKEITDGALEIFVELTEQNSLYKGAEFLPNVRKFIRAKRKYTATLEKNGELAAILFTWEAVATLTEAVTHIRNSAVGTLLVDLSEGMELDRAVAKYETVVAPTNYQRPTALVTQKMIDSAKAKAEELGLVSALTRRHAEQRDISVNDVLFVDRDVKKNLSDGSMFADLAPTKAVNEAKDYKNIEEVTIEKFLSDILPGATQIELLMENRHKSNLMSLVAPVDPTANKLFKWNNNFSWAYSGNVADSIKERVKAAGGNVTGELCCRLSWSNHDDLDFHFRSQQGREIYFGSKRGCGGELDVDMNAGAGTTRQPVENIFWRQLSDLPVGKHELFVHQYCRREMDNVGFDVEIEILGKSYTFSYPTAVSNQATITVAYIEKNEKEEVKVIPVLPETTAPKEVWGITTQKYQPVELVCYSPNYWGDNQVGHKHYIFAIKDCKNPDKVRGFLNEFLDTRLKDHRKVFELLGSKTQAEYSDNQISGLGFSSTIRNEILCRVTGATKRIIKLKF